MRSGHRIDETLPIMAGRPLTCLSPKRRVMTSLRCRHHEGGDHGPPWSTFQRSGPAGCIFLTRRALSSRTADFRQERPAVIGLLRGIRMTYRGLMRFYSGNQCVMSRSVQPWNSEDGCAYG